MLDYEKTTRNVCFIRSPKGEESSNAVANVCVYDWRSSSATYLSRYPAAIPETAGTTALPRTISS
jgi:hypothetical protein